MTTTYLETVNDLVHDVLTRAGEALDDTTDTDYELYDFVISALNRAYRIICEARTDWKWLRKSSPGTLVFKPDQASGTVTVTNNSATITFSSGPAATVAGYIFHVIWSKDTFRISTHTAASTTAVLDSVYTGDTASGAAYNLIKLEYALASDFVRMIDPIQLTQTGYDARHWGEMEEISPYEMNRNFPLQFLQQGVPSKYAFVGESTVRINRYPSTLIRAEYDYHYRPADLTPGGTPVLPLERRVLIADFALATLLDSKADDRAEKWLQLANTNINNFIQEYEYQTVRNSPHLLRIFPRQGTTSVRTTLRSPSGLSYR